MSALTTEQIKVLCEEAIAVRNNAYAPFSKFHVGAALLTERGELITGANVENSSYGLTNCAERTAVFTAVAGGARQILAIAIATPGGHGPCGACRQVLYEFGPEMDVLLVDSETATVTHRCKLSELLPRGFRLS